MGDFKFSIFGPLKKQTDVYIGKRYLYVYRNVNFVLVFEIKNRKVGKWGASTLVGCSNPPCGAGDLTHTHTHTHSILPGSSPHSGYVVNCNMSQTPTCRKLQHLCLQTNRAAVNCNIFVCNQT